LCAGDGRDAIALARSERPDLVIMDLDLGEEAMSGWEATRQIKEDPETRSILVFALTGNVMPHQKKLAIEAGCDDIAPKPFDLTLMPQKIRDLLDARRTP